ARTLTGHYAEQLLDNYMLAGRPNTRGRRNAIITQLLFGKPVHDFHLDYHMCCDAGLEVAEMDTKESDVTKGLVEVLHNVAYQGRICQPITDYSQQPFIAFYPA